MIQVQEFMERVGIRNQTELANKLGLTQSAVSAWNAGVRSPTYETCIDLLKMGMTISELFGDEVAAMAKAGNTPHDSGDFDESVKQAMLRILSK